VQAWGRSRWRRQLVGSSSGSQAGTHDQFGFVVDDLDAEVARLRAEGVQFNSRPAGCDDPRRDHGSRRREGRLVQDSEGDLISIAQFRNGSPLRR
jgi:hypothetical protein